MTLRLIMVPVSRINLLGLGKQTRYRMPNVIALVPSTGDRLSEVDCSTQHVFSQTLASNEMTKDFTFDLTSAAV